MTDIALHAYPFGNVGDDLFIQTICHRYPEVQFHLAMDRAYAHAFTSTQNLTIYPSTTLISRLKKSPFPRAIGKKIGATVYIGGSLFIEQPGWEQAFTRVGNCRSSARPYFIIGANFGPYMSDTFLDHHRAFFTNITDICFRDQYSHRLFADIPHARYAPDVLFSLRDRMLLRQNKPSEKHLVLSVIYPSIRPALAGADEAYYSAMAHVAREALQRGYVVTISAFCPYEQDDVAVEDILRNIPADERGGIRIHTYDGDLEAVCRLFETATAVVATRFHAVILGWLFEKKVLPISYSPKMDRVFADIGYEGEVQQVSSVDVEACVAFLERAQPRVDVDALAEEARGHFTELDRFVSGTRQRSGADGA